MAEELLQDSAAVDAAEPVRPEVPTDSPETPETPEPVSPEPRRDRVSERFNRLTRSLADKDRDIAALQRQVDHIRQQVPPPSSARPAAPPPSGAPVVSDYPDYDAYVVAVAGWQAEQALVKREEQQRERAAAERQTKQQQTWATQIQAAQTKYTDWDDVLDDADVPVTPALQEALLTSEQGADVLYYLAKHKDEAAKLATLSPFAVARAIGRIEATLVVSPSPSAPVAPVVTAPPPVTPIGGGGGTRTTVDPGQMSPQEYRAWRERQRR